LARKPEFHPRKGQALAFRASRLTLKTTQWPVQCWGPGHPPPSSALSLVLMLSACLRYVVLTNTVNRHCLELGQCHSCPSCIRPTSSVA
jgi:hypothetical protein